MPPKSRLMSPKLLPWAPQGFHSELHLGTQTLKKAQKLECFWWFRNVCRTHHGCLLDPLFGHLVLHMNPHIAHIGPKELPKAAIWGVIFCTCFAWFLSWMIDRAEKVPKRSQKAILATFWPHFDTCLLHFQTLWTPLDLYTMIFQSIFGCFAKSMHTNFKEPSKSPEHPKCRNTSRCGGVASAFSIK